MNLARLILSSCSAVLLCGCGTFCNAIAIAYPPPEEDPPNYVYGGVKVDAKIVQSGFDKDNVKLSDQLWTLLFLADIPLSAVFDTLWLPVTILETERISDRWAELKERRMKYAGTKDGQASVNPPAPTPDTTSESN